MNLVGKIFIVLIFVFSLVLMTLSVSVYISHQNWRRMVENTTPNAGYPLGLRPQLEALEKENQALQTEDTRLQDALQKERTDRVAKVTALERERDRFQSEYEKVCAELEETQKQLALHAENAKRNAEKAEQLEQDNARQVEQIAASLDAKNREREINRVLYSRLTDIETALRNSEARKTDLTREIAKLNEVCQYLNLQTYRATAPPSGLTGSVRAASANGNVEITVGSDDGVLAGHRFNVLSPDGTRYLGVVEVVEIRPDFSICKDVPRLKQGTYTTGCKVTPRTER
ncbi:MAG: hypothetical protein Q4D38_09075 [Planctomycetia bacterium]|nr:hypothetical protein [Planctomycetia bacterium]